MGTLGYPKQVICEVTSALWQQHGWSAKSGWTMNQRVESEYKKEILRSAQDSPAGSYARKTAQLSSTKSFFYELAHGLSFYARASSLKFGHHVFHHRAHIFHRG